MLQQSPISSVMVGRVVIALGLLCSLATLSTAAEKPEEAVTRLIERLRNDFKESYGSDEWAGVLRELILLGPEATPALSKALDAEEDQKLLRCLGFVMRGIGDKRAVPALIRNFPKAVNPTGSDMGYRCTDPELLAFMQKHDNSDRDDRDSYSFGRPINELRTALQKLTGTKHTEDELVFVELSGTAEQKRRKRELYERCALRWVDWWNLHGKELVTDSDYATVKVSFSAPETTAATVLPSLVLSNGGGASNCVLESVRDRKAKRVFHDLDTGRRAALPEYLQSPPGQSPRLDDIRAWADKEGFDLMCDEYFVPGDEQPHYVLRALGLTAWQMDATKWKKIYDELAKKEPIMLSRWTNNLLNNFNDDRGCYVPETTALFAFRTREGTYGLIFIGVEVHDDQQKPGGRSNEDNELNPTHFYKGRRYAYKMFADPAEAVAP